MGQHNVTDNSINFVSMGVVEMCAISGMILDEWNLSNYSV